MPAVVETPTRAENWDFPVVVKGRLLLNICVAKSGLSRLPSVFVRGSSERRAITLTFL